jgi:hypothetical protein
MMLFVSSLTGSKLFTMFMLGCERRMGRFVKQGLGISFKMLEAILPFKLVSFGSAENAVGIGKKPSMGHIRQCPNTPKKNRTFVLLYL